MESKPVIDTNIATSDCYGSNLSEHIADAIPRGVKGVTKYPSWFGDYAFSY